MISDHTTSDRLRLARDGDNDQLGQLLEQYRGYLLMLGHRYLSDSLKVKIDPDDLVQITFEEATRDWSGFRGTTPGEFAGWLRNILKNNVSTAVARHVTAKKRSIRREVHFSGAGEDGDSAGKWLAERSAHTTSPSGKAIRAEAAQELYQALLHLPENQAEAIRLRYIEGLSLADISDRMSKSDTAIAGLLKRGLVRLRSLLRLDPEAF